LSPIDTELSTTNNRSSFSDGLKPPAPCVGSVGNGTNPSSLGSGVGVSTGGTVSGGVGSPPGGGVTGGVPPVFCAGAVEAPPPLHPAASAPRTIIPPSHAVYRERPFCLTDALILSLKRKGVSGESP